MFGVFRKSKSKTQNCPGSNKPPLITAQNEDPATLKFQQNMTHQPYNQQTFNPVMYVTGPQQTLTNDKSNYPKSNGEVYQNGGGHLTHQNGGGHLTHQNGGGHLTHHNGGGPQNGHLNHHPHHTSIKHSKSERAGSGPPPVQSKWVDLNDPNQKVRKGRTHRHNPAVIRSTSASSVKSQGSVGSNYSTKSEQFKNSVRIPDSKFSGSWTSNESMGTRSNTSKQGKRVREWNIDVGRKPDSIKPPASLKSSCGNVSTASSGKPPYLTGHMSSSTPPPSYHSDPLSQLSNNGSVMLVLHCFIDSF